MSIIQVPYEVVQYRQWVQESFRLHPLPTHSLPTPSAAFTTFDLFRPNACLTYATDAAPFQQAPEIVAASGLAVPANPSAAGVDLRVAEVESKASSLAASDVAVTPSPAFQNDEGGDNTEELGRERKISGGCHKVTLKCHCDCISKIYIY